MKATAAVALPVALLAMAGAAPTEEVPPVAAPPRAEVGWVPVVRARSAPVIDGAAGESWSPAVTRRLERSKGPMPSSADIQAEFRGMWDEDALYVLVQVLDDETTTREGPVPWEHDSVEVYVDGDGSRNDAVDGYDGNDRQFVFRWDDPVAHATKGASVESLRFAQSEWEHGYRMEIAIPWSTLGVAPGAGSTIGLDVHVNDDDGVGREDKIMWSDGSDAASSEPRRFGKAVLLDALEATEEQRATLTVAAPDLGRELAGEPPLRLQYHDIRADAGGMILPWSHDEPAVAYDQVIRLVWGFWRQMEDCPNGVKYYLQHQVWKPEHDPRGLGGDQINMALSSWNLLHQYLGDPGVVADMRLQADYWIENGLTGPDGPWPNLPFPYNTDIHSGRYDGDMVAGKGFLQPDKAGSFGTELVTLHKITAEPRYLEVAVGIADTLARNAKPGDQDHSPWPYRVHFETGEVFEKEGVRFTYTTNWTGALRLFDDLIAMEKGSVDDYEKARTLVSDWLKTYPLKTMRWGPFFEDINTYSDTQINAGTLARYILEHPGWMPDGEEAVRRILDDCDRKFSNPFWAKYGVRATNEQTAYEVPGNSHTSRQNALELMWAEATGDWSRKDRSVRNLNWATYMVAEDGRNRYYRDDIWLTDGYGDYIRHYLRAMAAAPDLAPPDQNHLLRTTSVVRSVEYGDDAVTYEKWDAGSRERLKLGEWEPGEVEGGTFTWDPETRVLEVESGSRRVVVRRAES
ncbi:MAG: hypothetical protein LJF30_12325 [Acidobacteria bacterium]|nr:hypothetical protein [Acidobacteriota bacterium]